MGFAIATYQICVTVFKDQDTPAPFIDQLPTSDDVRLNNTLADHVCLDCMGFGMGMCCLQVSWNQQSCVSVTFPLQR